MNQLLEWSLMRAAGRGCRRRGFEVAAVLGLALAGSTAAMASGGAEVSNARFQFIIKARPAAGYFQFENITGSKERLVGAISPDCGKLMIHRSHETKGVDTMQTVAGIDVPAGQTVTFAPGGYHLMCMSPNLKVGEMAPVTLKFADGSTVTAGFKVHGPKTQ